MKEKQNNFPLNEEESKQYRPLLCNFYNYIEPGCWIKYYDGQTRFEKAVQRILHVDLTLTTNQGDESYEEKIVRPEDQKPYEKIYAETESCTFPGKVTDGWMKTCYARYLVYIMVTLWGLDIYLINFPAYKKWFWDEIRKSSRFQPHRNERENQTQGVLVPLHDLYKRGWVKRYLLTFDGGCKQIGTDANLEEEMRAIQNKFVSEQAIHEVEAIIASKGGAS